MADYSAARVHEVFSAALAQPLHARDEFLRVACGGNSALLKEVAQLLDIHADLERADESAGTPADAELIGALIGPYQVLRLLGAGGMGRVYLAARADGAFQRDVAIKVINPSAASEDVMARFEDECRILASVQHPSITTLLDAGRTPDGGFYFVMEYVDGLPITTHCDRHGLGVRARLTLFRRVCEAVSVAHRNLIIHRDLKPANLLVDVAGTPKLLDFGIAKAMTRAGLEAGLATHPLLKRATPAYASPEQLQGETAHTGMDVFALGVILHELLTGRRPTAVPVGETTATDTGAYEKPSLMAGSAAVPGGVPARDIDEDLDGVVLKAIHPDVRTRYASVDTLSRDIQSWLDGFPVEARPSPAFDRALKFVWRNRVPVAVAALVISALIIALVSVIRLWQGAQREHVLATERFNASRALAASLFDVEEALTRVAGTTAPRQALTQSLSEYLQRVRKNAEGHPSLLFDIAEGHRRVGDVQGNPNTSNLGDRSNALQSYETATGMLRQLRASEPGSVDVAVALARTRSATGDVLAAQQQHAEALAAYEEALALAEELVRNHQTVSRYQVLAAGIHRPIGDIALAQNQPERALVSYQKALGIETALAQREGNTGERRRLLALSRLRVAAARAAQGGWREARDEYQAAVASLRDLSGSGVRDSGIVRDTAIGLMQLASLSAAHDQQAALEQMRSAMALLRQLLVEDPADARVRRDLVAALVQYGDSRRATDLQEARHAYREARSLAEVLRADPFRDTQSERDLAVIDERLAAGPAAARPELTLFAIAAGRKRLLAPGDVPPSGASRVSASATAPPGWSRYLILLGAEGAATIYDEAQLVRAGWTLPLSGPPPAQTILLLTAPRPLPETERRQLESDLGAVPGPRAIDWDSQVIWTSDAEPRIISTATARGGNTEWVKLVRARLARVKDGKFAGRTFPIAPPRE